MIPIIEHALKTLALVLGCFWLAVLVKRYLGSSVGGAISDVLYWGMIAGIGFLVVSYHGA